MAKPGNETQEAELPEAWKPKGSAEAEAAERAASAVVVPNRISDDSATLAAWYYGGSAAFVEYMRKIVQAKCRELIRAKFVLAGEKVSESRLDDLSRLHEGYVGFVTEHLLGRTLWESERLKSGIGA